MLSAYNILQTDTLRKGLAISMRWACGKLSVEALPRLGPAAAGGVHVNSQRNEEDRRGRGPVAVGKGLHLTTAPHKLLKPADVVGARYALEH